MRPRRRAPPLPPADAAAAIAMWEKVHADGSDDGSSSDSAASSSGSENGSMALAHLRAHNVDERTSVLFASRYPSVEHLAHVRDEDIHELDAAHQSPQLNAAIDAAHRAAKHDALGLLLDLGLSLEEAIEISSARHDSGAHRHWRRHRRQRPRFETVSVDDADDVAACTSIQRAAATAPHSAPQLHLRRCEASGRTLGGDGDGDDRRGAAAPGAATVVAAAIAAAANTSSEAEIVAAADAGVTAPPRTRAAAPAGGAAVRGGARKDETNSSDECFVGEWHAFCSVGAPEVPMGAIKKIIQATSLGKRRIADDRIRAACKMTIARNAGAEATSSNAAATYAFAVDATEVTHNSVTDLKWLEDRGTLAAPRRVRDAEGVVSNFGDARIFSAAHYFAPTATTMGGGWLSPTVEMWALAAGATSLPSARRTPGGVVGTLSSSAAAARSATHAAPAEEEAARVARVAEEEALARVRRPAKGFDPLEERCDWMLGPGLRGRALGVEDHEWLLFGSVCVRVLGRDTTAYFSATRAPLRLWRPICVASLTPAQRLRVFPPPKEAQPRLRLSFARRRSSAAAEAQAAAAAAAPEWIWLNIVSGVIERTCPVAEDELLPPLA